MCRPKPGLRCPTCQTKALDSITARLGKLTLTIADTPPGTKRARLEAEQHELARQVQCRRADLYATSDYQRRQSAELAELLAADPIDRKKVAAIADKLVEGRLMERYRSEQNAAMPALPDSDLGRDYHRRLGDARFDLAHARLRMDLTRGNTSQWQEWQQRHHEAAQRAALASARMTAVEAGGPGGWSSLPVSEQTRLRDEAAQDPTLGTPVAPRRFQDIVDETQDIIDNHVPVREVLDDTSIPPFGDPTPRIAEPALRPRQQAGSDDHGNRGETAHRDAGDPRSKTEPEAPSSPTPSRAQESTSRQQALADQQRRRSTRRRSSRASWRQLRTGSRRVQANMDRLDRSLDEMGSNRKEEGGIYDLTLLSYFSEKLSAGGRR